MVVGVVLTVAMVVVVSMLVASRRAGVVGVPADLMRRFCYQGHAFVLVMGMYVGMRLNEPFKYHSNLFSFRSNQFNKINDVVNYINQEYVDTVNQKKLVENTIEGMLHNLDPHSVYISADELQSMNEELQKTLK